MKRKIAIVLTGRCNYGRLKPTMKTIQEHPELELQLICTGTMVLERFDRAADLCKEDGFKIDAEIFVELEGSVPTSMAKSVGLVIIELANCFNYLKPDFLLVIGDRYETIGASITACYMGICIAHIQGGEASGALDESARHAITKMAHYHFPSTDRANEFLLKMGELPETVFKVGCPVCDIAFNLDKTFDKNPFYNRGIGNPVDPSKPYFIVIFHPDTCDLGKEEEHTKEIMASLNEFNIQTCWLWANIDSGGDNINKYLRRIHEYKDPSWLQFVKNFPPEVFQKILANASCAIGNSSSFVRDSTFYGTPVVLIGKRQKGRETGLNVIAVPPKKDLISNAIKKQLENGSYQPDTLYGDGNASKKIAEYLAKIPIYSQKRLSYLDAIKTV